MLKCQSLLMDSLLHQSLLMDLGSSFFFQDAFVRRCKKKRQMIMEEDLWVDGQFMSEQDMVDCNIKE